MIDFLLTNSIEYSRFKNFSYFYKIGLFKIASKKKIITWENNKKDIYFYITNNANKFKQTSLEDPIKCKDIEGSFVIIKFSQKGIISIWTDKFSKEDLFYTSKNKYCFITTSLENLEMEYESSKYDKFGISQSLIIYGNRPSKKDTFYKSIKRLGYYEILEINNQKIKIIRLQTEFLNSYNYTKKDIDKYFEIFIETLKNNSSRDDNIIFLSSGWDSTSILAGLRYIYDKRKIRCLTLRLNYSEKYGTTNQIEIDKAKRFADYYGVKLEIINLNYLSENFLEEYLNKINTLFKSKNLSMGPGLGHYLLTEKAAELKKSSDTTVFSGEMSDGAHNLGFSQYTTIFHPNSQNFREYSDKMMSYLFGPTFLNNIKNNNVNDDPVWKILRNIYDKKIELSEKKKNYNVLKKIFLRSFFAQSTRFPMYALENEVFLSAKGCIDYENYMFNNYFNYYSEKLNNKNHYSVFLNLYNSFHWQGSTVATLKICADFHKLNLCNPFHSLKIFNYLSQMPESWGRGLDLNSTKYPLKQILKEKLNYPLYLQEGYHSYIYDRLPSFSHSEELLMRSKLRGIAIKKLINSKIINNLDKKYFNVGYIRRLINAYQQNQKLKLKEIDNLRSLVFTSLIDSY